MGGGRKGNGGGGKGGRESLMCIQTKWNDERLDEGDERLDEGDKLPY